MEKQVHVSGHEDRNTIPVEIIYVDERFHSDKPEHDKFVKLTYGSEGAAAVDIVACIDEPLTLRPGERVKFSTGIKLWLNNVNAGAFMLPRSGIGSDQGIVLANLTGLIDSDFQGVMQIPLWNSNPQVIWDEETGGVRYNKEAEFTVHPGDRICQMTLLEVLHGNYLEVDKFSGVTKRGEGGFGSTKGIVEREGDVKLYGMVTTDVEILHYAPTPIDNVLRLHGLCGDNPIWIDIMVGDHAPDIEALKFPLTATFKHTLDFITSLNVKQNGEEFEWCVNMNELYHQFIDVSHTGDARYRVGGSNLMAAVPTSHLADFAEPAQNESTYFSAVKGDKGLVSFKYQPKV